VGWVNGKHLSGLQRWYYDHWLGILYNSRRRYLEQYARFFHSVEVNSTFYQFPKEGQLKNWYNVTPDDFVFSVKLNRHITHTKRLYDTRRALSDFFEICGVLGHKLGPFLLGLAASFKKDLDRLDEFISLLPAIVLLLNFVTIRGLATIFLTVLAAKQSLFSSARCTIWQQHRLF